MIEPILIRPTRIDGLQIEVWPYALGQYRIKIKPPDTEQDPYPSSLREM